MMIAELLENLRRAAIAGDEEAANEIAKIMLPLVQQVATRFGRQGDELDDLVSAGLVAIPKAIKTYDKTRNTSFEAFIKACARNGMIEQMRAEDARGPLSVGRAGVRGRTELRQTERRLTAELGRRPSIEEISARSGYTVSRVEALLTPMKAVALAEDVTSDEGTQTEDEILERIDVQHPAASDSMRERLAQAIDDLPPRQREAVTLHCGLDGAGALPISDVARCMGLTPRHVRRLIAASADALKGRIAQA